MPTTVFFLLGDHKRFNAQNNLYPRYDVTSFRFLRTEFDEEQE